MPPRVLPRLLRCAAVVLAVAVFLAVSQHVAYAQSNPKEQTPVWKDFYVKQEMFRQRGAETLAAEKEHEKHDPCKDVASTIEIDECLSREFKLATSNYTAYLRALGGLVRLSTPGTTKHGLQPTDPGHSLDAAEALWTKYRDTQCDSVGDQYWGGTMRSGQIMSCRLKLTRQHIRDLADTYSDLWH